jgi:adenylosuccinate synthase
VLTGLDRVGIVTTYRAGGESLGFEAAGRTDLQVDVEEMPGWSEAIDDCRRIADLPKAARAYLARLGDVLAVPIELVSVGRERSQLAR